MQRRVGCSLRLGLVLLAGTLSLAGCGGGSGGGGTITPPPPTGPASGTEFLYLFETAGIGADPTVDLMVSTVNPSTGAISTPIYAAGNVASAEFLGINRGIIITPSAKFIYMVGYTLLNGTGIYAESIVGPQGTGLSTLYLPTTPLSQRAGIVAMDATSKFMWVQDGSMTNPATPTLRTFALDATTGAPTAGPVMALNTSWGYHGWNTDAAGKYMYALVEYASSSTPLGYVDSLLTYSIDAGTGALTAVPGMSVDLQEPPSGLGLAAYGIVFSPSGKNLYVLADYESDNNSILLGSAAVYGFAVDASTGAATAIVGSPFPVGNLQVSSMAFRPQGDFIFVTGTDAGTMATGAERVFPVDPTTGAIGATPVATASDLKCCTLNLIDPSGTVLVDLLGEINQPMNEFIFSPTAMTLTPAAGVPLTPSEAYTEGVMVKIP